MSPGRDRLGPEKPSVRLCWQGGRQRLWLSAHRLGPPPGQGMPTRPGCAVPSTSVPPACKATIAFVRRSFVSGSHRGPPSPCPLDSAALRPQGHSHGVQLSLPLSKVHRSPRQVPAAPASSAPVQGPHPGRGRGAPAPHRAPRSGPGSVAAPLAAGAQSWFWGAPLAGGVRATRASFLGSPSPSLPAGHPRASRPQPWHLPRERGRQDGSVPAGLARGSAGPGGTGTPQGPAIALVPVGTPCPACPPGTPLGAAPVPLMGRWRTRPPPRAAPRGERCQPSPGHKGGAGEGARSHRCPASLASLLPQPCLPRVAPLPPRIARGPGPGGASRRRQDPPPAAGPPGRVSLERPGCSRCRSSSRLAGIPALPCGAAFPRSGCRSRCRS